MRRKQFIPEKKFPTVLITLIVGLFLLLFINTYIAGEPLEKVSEIITPGWSQGMSDQRWRMGT